jgi:hypothetical protein
LCVAGRNQTTFNKIVESFLGISPRGYPIADINHLFFRNEVEKSESKVLENIFFRMNFKTLFKVACYNLKSKRK